jgi:hypothetical protein
MRLSVGQLLSDRKRMEEYICERIVNDGTKIVLAAGEEGESWAELYPIWDDEMGWELYMERSDEHVSLQDVYDHLRRKEMTSAEWWRAFNGEMDRWKVKELEKEGRELREQAAHSPDDDLLHVRRKVEAIEQMLRGQSESGSRSLDLLQSQPSVGDDLPDCLPARTAARLLGVDRKTLNKFRRDGLLKWRLKNPSSSRKEFLYEKASVLALATDYRVGESTARQETRRRRRPRTYVPKHIRLD